MPPTSTLIRDANLHDIPSIYQMVLSLAEFEKMPEMVTCSLADYKKEFAESTFSCRLALVDQEIVGMTIYYLTFSTWKGRMLYLEDFFVLPEYRSKGIGQLLFDDFIARAKALNCTMAKWQVLDWNKAAIKFYVRNKAEIEDNWYNGKIIF